jgi:hypothetical protein
VTLGNATENATTTTRYQRNNNFSRLQTFPDLRNHRPKDPAPATQISSLPHHTHYCILYGPQRPWRLASYYFKLDNKNLLTFLAPKFFRAKLPDCNYYLRYPDHFQPLYFDPGKSTMPQFMKAPVDRTDIDSPDPTDSMSKKSARLLAKAEAKEAKKVKMLEKAKALVAAAAAETDTVMTDPAPAASPSKHADKRARSDKGNAHLTAATTASSPGEKRKPKAKDKTDLKTPGKGSLEKGKEEGLDKNVQVTPEKEPAAPVDPATIPLPVTPKSNKNNPIDLASPVPGSPMQGVVIDSPPTTPQRRNQNNEPWEAEVINRRDYSVFFDVQMEVPAGTKEEAVGALKDVAVKFFSVLQDADPTAILGNFTSSDNQRALLLPANMPTTITKLGQYFMRARPNPAGGLVYTSVRLAFNGDEVNLLRDTEFELSDLNIRLYRRPLQVPETIRKGWFCGVPSGVCTIALQDLLMTIMRAQQIKGLSEREILHSERIMIALRRHK